MFSRIEPEKKCCMLSEIAAYIRTAGSIGIVGFGRYSITLTTDNAAVARHLKKLIKAYFDIDTSLEIYEGGFEVKTAVIAFVTGAVCAVIGTVGDLSASMVKRQIGFKDYGKIMPGHGGLMDRFDSVLFVLPTFYVFLNIMNLF